MQEYSNKFVLSSANLIDLLCYPRFNTSDYYSRLSELRSLNLKFVILEGSTLIRAIRILGKGSEGLVLKVQNTHSKTMALKIKRIDSCRTDMKNEFEFYQSVNRNHLGPKVYSYTKNTLLMEFIEGLSARTWFLKTKINLELIRKIIINILTQCYTLDKLHIDHGQLNKLDNHVIISHHGSKCTIVDFESASCIRKVNNVTSAFQGLIFKGIISDQINKFANYDKKRVEFLNLLSRYKMDMSKKNFDSIIALI
jgi:putative serine/threonine protein kinase